ncbi:MAG: aminotransferase class I/II-fold pyridoxal phosphate-dependent enzyme [Actinomycetota bacterium]
MKVEASSLSALRNRTSEKWTEFPPDVLPMPVAEMDFELAQPIRDRLIEMINNSDTGYMGETQHLGHHFSEFASKYWNWIIKPDQLYLCADVGVGMIEMARTIVSPGAKIMINAPVYLNMFNWIREVKCEIYDAPLHKDGMHYTLDFAAIEEGYKAGVKIHFLCNPQNPTGTVHTRDELTMLAELAYKYDVYVFSDEIHAPMVFNESVFTPFLSVSAEAREIGVCVTAASKAWNLAGLKCAFIITESDRINSLAKSMPHSVRFRASLFGAHAAAVAYECTDWLEALKETLDRNREFLYVQLQRKLPQAKYRIPNCSYLAWIDVSAYDLGVHPASTILKRGKLALTPGHLFGADCDQFVRLNYATSEEIIAEGIDRIVASLNN